MNKKDFIKELEYLLQDIPDAEKEDAIAYYRDYLEEAGEEQEDDAVRELGSPERVAAIIRADLNGNLKEGGEFTDTGYQDERFRDPRYQVAERKDLPDVTESGEASRKRGNPDGTMPRRRFFARLLKVFLILTLICTVVPALTGIGSGIYGIVVTLVCVFGVAVLLIGILTATALVSGVILLVYGVCTLTAKFWTAISLLGFGIIFLGLGLLGAALSIFVYGKLIPWIIRTVTNWISDLLYRKRGNRS